MQNRYVGDIGDFGKFGLLRFIEDTGLRMGINWYLTPDEAHNNDGQHIAYLRARMEEISNCDPDLFHVLDRIVETGSRNVVEIRARGIFQPHTSFFERPHSYDPGMTPNTRRRLREDWHSAAVDAMSSSDLVFIDPDNGLEGVSANRYRTRGPKYVYFDDLRDYYDRGQSLVIYHHLDRSVDALSQAKRRVGELQQHLGVARPIAVKFNRISPRFYFIVPAEPHEGLLHECIGRFIAGPWGRHFSWMH